MSARSRFNFYLEFGNVFFFKGSTRRKISRRKAEETRITYRVHSGTSNRATRYNRRWIVVCQSLTFIFEGQWTCINCLTASDFVIMSLVCHMTVSWAQVCPAVLVKIKVCGGCSVSRAHKTFFRSILFCICQLIEITGFFFKFFTDRLWDSSNSRLRKRYFRKVSTRAALLDLPCLVNL